MIQRIQTLFLFFALLMMLSLFFNPFATFITPQDEVISLYFEGVRYMSDGGQHSGFSAIPLASLIIVINLLILVIIFLYKYRMLQIRLSVFTALLSVGCEVMIFFYIFQVSKEFNTDQYSYSVTIVFPVIAVILLILAIRRIRMDDLLVKSYNRIR